MTREKRWRYIRSDNKPVWIKFHPNNDCIFCNEPVIELSIAGPLICPQCDSGNNIIINDYNTQNKMIDSYPIDDISVEYEFEYSLKYK